MARFYADISKRYDKLFEKDTYNLNRAVTVNVDGGKVNWSSETKLDANNKIASKLKVKNDLGRDNFELETSVTKNPKFTFTTTRLPIFKTKVSVLEPTLETEISKQSDKIAWNLKGSYDWKVSGWEAESSVCYLGFDKFALGAKVSVDQPGKDKNIGVKDYNVKIEWQRSPDQTVVLQTEKKLSTVKLGGFATLRENYVGFAQVDLDRNNMKKLGWEAGIEKKINDASSVTGIFRQGSVGSVLYKGKIEKFEGHLAYNCDMKKQPGERHSLEYKLVFNF